MAKIPTFPSAYFNWKGGEGKSTIGKLGVSNFPNSFYIKSARTGEVKLFLNDAETMEANEYFDGEGAAYFSPGGDAKVQIWAGGE
jgi:hypothetical protein